jgi:hypothetical protein
MNFLGVDFRMVCCGRRSTFDAFSFPYHAATRLHLPLELEREVCQFAVFSFLDAHPVSSLSLFGFMIGPGWYVSNFSTELITAI